MADLNYFNTLIAVADDCPVDRAVVPTERSGKPSIAVLQHRMLSAHRYVLTQEDVLFETWLARQHPPVPTSERDRLREEFFAKPQACLRSSPLPKRYGWGLVFDGEGRVALLAMESAEYRRLLAPGESGPAVLKALRSTRSPRDGRG